MKRRSTSSSAPQHGPYFAVFLPSIRSSAQPQATCSLPNENGSADNLSFFSCGPSVTKTSQFSGLWPKIFIPPYLPKPIPVVPKEVRILLRSLPHAGFASAHLSSLSAHLFFFIKSSVTFYFSFPFAGLSSEMLHPISSPIASTRTYPDAPKHCLPTRFCTLSSFIKRLLNLHARIVIPHH